MSGVDHIKLERQRQLLKGWDDTVNDDGQLTECASYILGDYMEDTCDGVTESYDWPVSRATKVKQKYRMDYVARLRIAGALIAAEIDRIESLNNSTQKGQP